MRFGFVCRLVAWLLLGAAPAAPAAGVGIQRLGPTGLLTWTNAFTNGVCTIESAPRLPGGTNRAVWTPQQSYYTTNSTGSGSARFGVGSNFFRLRAADLSTNTMAGFTNLVQAYGLLHTLAGNGLDGGVDGVNYWQPAFEGGYATNAALSRPHFALGDTNGNVFVVDKDSHSLLKITPDGRLHTVAGTHQSGNGPDTATVATNVALNAPNGGWLRGDGTVYILDTGNGKVRRLDPTGRLTTLFTDAAGISTGRGLWVRDDEALAYYASGSKLRMWTPAKGSKTLNSQFNDLGNLIFSGTNLVVTDRGNNSVWLVNTNGGVATLLFGNGSAGPAVDNSLALTNSLYGVRGIWQPPTGGWFLATHEGAQLLYVDPAGILRVLVTGGGENHAGDGQWFYTAGSKFGQLRSVTLDPFGNLLIVENDLGFVRRIDFQRLTP